MNGAISPDCHDDVDVLCDRFLRQSPGVTSRLGQAQISLPSMSA